MIIIYYILWSFLSMSLQAASYPWEVTPIQCGRLTKVREWMEVALKWHWSGIGSPTFAPFLSFFTLRSLFRHDTSAGRRVPQTGSWDVDDVGCRRTLFKYFKWDSIYIQFTSTGYACVLQCVRSKPQDLCCCNAGDKAKASPVCFSLVSSMGWHKALGHTVTPRHGNTLKPWVSKNNFKCRTQSGTCEEKSSWFVFEYVVECGRLQRIVVVGYRCFSRGYNVLSMTDRQQWLPQIVVLSCECFGMWIHGHLDIPTIACDGERRECTCSLIFVCFVDIDWGIPGILQVSLRLCEMGLRCRIRLWMECGVDWTSLKWSHLKDRYTDKVYSKLSFFVWACCSLRQSADPTKAQPDVGCVFHSLNFWHGVNWCELHRQLKQWDVMSARPKCSNILAPCIFCCAICSLWTLGLHGLDVYLRIRYVIGMP